MENKKEFTWAALVGTGIGFLCGVAIALSMAREAKKCEDVKRENEALKKVIIYYQDLEQKREAAGCAL